MAEITPMPAETWGLPTRHRHLRGVAGALGHMHVLLYQTIAVAHLWQVPDEATHVGGGSAANEGGWDAVRTLMS